MKPEELDKEILGEIASTFLALERQLSVQDIKDHMTEKYEGEVSEGDVEESLKRLIIAAEIEYDEFCGKTVLTLSQT